MRRKGERTFVLSSITYYPITKSEPDPCWRAKPRVFFSQSMRADVGRPRGGHLDQIVLAQPVNGWGVSG